MTEYLTVGVSEKTGSAAFRSATRSILVIDDAGSPKRPWVKPEVTVLKLDDAARAAEARS